MHMLFELSLPLLEIYPTKTKTCTYNNKEMELLILTENWDYPR